MFSSSLDNFVVPGIGTCRDPRLTGEQPSERNFRGCGLFLRGNRVQQVDEGLVRLQRFRREPGQSAEIVRRELGVGSYLAGKEALAERISLLMPCLFARAIRHRTGR